MVSGKFTREPPHVEPNKIFIISMEGAYSEPEYFQALIDKYGLNIKMDFELLYPEGESTGKSAPNHVIRRVEERIATKGTFNLRGGDKVWLVMDHDRWEKVLHTVIMEAKARSYGLAISNISFDTWMNFHEENCCVAEKKDCSSQKCKECSSEIRVKGFEFMARNVLIAVKNAKRYENAKTLRQAIPPKPRSRVYKIIEDLGIAVAAE